MITYTHFVRRPLTAATIFLLWMATALPVSAGRNAGVSSEAGSFGSIFDKYRKCRNVELVTLSPEIVRMLAEKDSNPILQDIDTLSVLNVKRYDEFMTSYYIDNGLPVASPGEVESAFLGCAVSNGLSLLVSVKNEDTDITVYMKRNPGDLSGYILCCCRNSGYMSFIVISGTISDRLTDAVMKGEISVE